MTAFTDFADIPRGHYRAICADPPWRFKSFTALQSANWSSRRDAEKHYASMTLDDIKALPVASLAHKEGCHLFLWVTGPMMPAALDVMAPWGFRFSTVAFSWAKLRRAFDPAKPRSGSLDGDFHCGLGLTTRKNCEWVLLGRKGNCRRVAKDVRELIVSPVHKHSQKPDETYTRIQRYCAGPYVELFAREARADWDCFGDELEATQ